MKDRMDWFNNARFGMFIHWGVYSVLERGEWVMYFERIPISEYEKYASQFNPTSYDPAQWVALAKKTGMKYIVITAKHHDGFSMFKTKVDPYNIVDATPYKKDPMSELAKECRKEGIVLCFYYTHVREWRHPHAQSLEVRTPDEFGNYGNFWDYPDENKKNLQIYMDEFNKPQLVELLTQYGPIGAIWFDTPSMIRPEQAKELADLVWGIQPNCLVNSRIGNGADYDYITLGDNEIPANKSRMPWETPMTICHAWGYNASAHNVYRTSMEVINQLIEVASLGGNFLLNVGPKGDGTIPEQALALFSKIGDWMGINDEAIHGTNASPFNAKPSWGRITSKGNNLYLHVLDWNSKIKLNGLLSLPTKAVILALPDVSVDIHLDDGMLTLSGLPEAEPVPSPAVIRLEFNDAPQISAGIIPNDIGDYRIPVTQGEVIDGEIELNESGVTKWMDKNARISFKFTCSAPGTFKAELCMKPSFFADYNHKIALVMNDERHTVFIEKPDHKFSYENPNKQFIYSIGTVTVKNIGEHEFYIEAVSIEKRNNCGIMLSSVNLLSTGT